MLALIVCCLIGLVIVYTAEYYHQQDRIVTETTRKIIHIAHGSLLMTLIFFSDRWLIIGAESVFFVLAIIARKYKLFKSQNEVGRKTWGELFLLIAVIIILLMNVPRWVFLVAVAHFTFADSAAALIGKKYGKTNTYKVFDLEKSIVGSMSFFAVSAVIIALALAISANASTYALSHASIYWIPLLTTIAENVGIFGSDNLLIILSVSLLLR